MKGLISGIQNLWNGILTIINGIKMGIEFLINIVKSIFALIGLLITTFSNVMTLLGTLPTWLLAFGTGTLAVVVLYMIIGRDTGK